MGHPAHGAFLLLDALLLLFRPPQVHRHRRTPWPRRAPYSKPAKRRDERRYSRLPAWQTLPANDRSAEQIASVLLWRNSRRPLSAAYPYDGRELLHSTDFTESARISSCITGQWREPPPRVNPILI